MRVLRCLLQALGIQSCHLYCWKACKSSCTLEILKWIIKLNMESAKFVLL